MQSKVFVLLCPPADAERIKNKIMSLKNSNIYRLNHQFALPRLRHRMSILAYNGGAIIAMTGKNCVAIASDTRLGLQQQTVACDFQKVRP